MKWNCVVYNFGFEIQDRNCNRPVNSTSFLRAAFSHLNPISKFAVEFYFGRRVFMLLIRSEFHTN